MNDEDRDTDFEIESANEIFRVDSTPTPMVPPSSSKTEPSEPSHHDADDQPEPAAAFDPFKGVVFPKLRDVFDSLRQGDYLPLIALLEKEPGADQGKTDVHGYAPVHYAASTGNVQALALLHEARPDCLNALSKGWQTPLMLACAACCPEALVFVAERVSSMRLDESDSWGFTPLAYCVKNNFVAGFFYLLYKGARLDKQYLDRGGDSLTHWAARNDRRLLLEFLHRAGFDFKKKGTQGETPFEKALNNWSLHSLVFMLQYSMISLDTFQLTNVGNEFMLDLVPNLSPELVKKHPSSYIPAQFKRITKANAITGGNLNTPIGFAAGINFIMDTGTEGLKLIWKKFSNRRTFILSVIGRSRPITVILLILALMTLPIYLLASTWHLCWSILMLHSAIWYLILLGNFD